MSFLKRIKKVFLSNKKLKFWYFKFSCFFANYGIRPLFSPSASRVKKAWTEQKPSNTVMPEETYLEEKQINDRTI